MSQHSLACVGFNSLLVSLEGEQIKTDRLKALASSAFPFI